MFVAMNREIPTHWRVSWLFLGNIRNESLDVRVIVGYDDSGRTCKTVTGNTRMPKHSALRNQVEISGLTRSKTISFLEKFIEKDDNLCYELVLLT